MFNRLFNPNFPRAAAGLRRESVSVVSLSKQGSGFALRRAATVELPPEVLQPDFVEQNIKNPAEVLLSLQEAVSSAGLQSQKKWSISLPADTARMSVLTLETTPKTAKEKTEILDWKAERAFGTRPEDLRLAFQTLAPDKDNRPRFFAIAVRLETLAEYEELFQQMRWSVGLVLPRHVSEAQWLALQKPKSTGDALLISSQADGFTAMLLRQSQPNVVRSVTCEISEFEDELYRLLMFYRDRFTTAGADSNLRKFLIIGDSFPQTRLHEIFNETLGHDLQILQAADVGLNLPDAIHFEDIAAPAGLASLAWR